MSDDDLTTACPECGSTAIAVRNPARAWSRDDSPHRWRCRDCDARFDEPIERERRIPDQIGESRSGLAGDLAAADPEEVFGDG